MKRTYLIATLLIAALLAASGANAQNLVRDYDNHDDDDNVYVDRVRIDRYLDVEIWTNHEDGDFYIGDRVVLSFRANQDAFVSIYSIDTKGRVNLIFPANPGEDNFVYGGVTYTLPGEDDDFDLVVAGPDGVENIQIVASREAFPIPDWYSASGLLCDWDDRHDFMDYVNAHYFVSYSGQRFAFDRTALWVNEWEPDYYRPIYRPYYPSWTVCGNIYIDYPWGATIYIDGVYWGCAPLYIPRIYVGWHTFTVYDPWGHCWERNVHVTRFHTVVLNREIVVPRAGTVSKYKEVHRVGYRDPVKHGYPKYQVKDNLAATAGSARKVVTSSDGKTVRTVSSSGLSKKYTRGSTKVVSTDRGIQTAGLTSELSTGTKRSITYGTKGRSSTMSGGSSSSKRTYSTGSSKSGSSDSRMTTSRKQTGSSGSSAVRSKSSSGSSKTGSSRIKTGSTKRQTSTTTKSGGSRIKSSSGGKKSTSTRGSSGTKSSSGTKKSSSSGSKSKKSR